MAKWFRSSAEHRARKAYKKAQKEKVRSKRDENKAFLDQGMFYFYLIVGSQVIFIFGLVAFMMGIGKVLATPWWIFLFGAVLLVSGCIYLYRKIKRQFRKIRSAFKEINIGGGNCEISVMGGFLTMRVEQNPGRLLEAPGSVHSQVLDAEPVEPSSTSQHTTLESQS